MLGGRVGPTCRKSCSSYCTRREWEDPATQCARGRSRGGTGPCGCAPQSGQARCVICLGAVAATASPCEYAIHHIKDEALMRTALGMSPSSDNTNPKGSRECSERRPGARTAGLVPFESAPQVATAPIDLPDTELKHDAYNLTTSTRSRILLQ